MNHKSSRGLWLLPVVVLAFSNLICSQTAVSPETVTAASESALTQSPDAIDLLHKANNHGVSFQGVLVYDWSKGLDSDQDSGAGFGRYSFDLSMSLDGRKALGWEGSAGFVRLKHHINHFGETYDGAAQIFSNIDAPSRTTLYELWLEQRLLSNKLRFKAGKIDANTEFASVPTAGDFLNSSMGFSPTIVAFPTYPQPKMGFGAFVHPTANYGVGFGVFQTAGMGTLSILEPGFSWNIGGGERPGRMSLGYWRLDGTLLRLDATPISATQGFYSVVEQSGWRHPWLGKDGERRLSTFFQFGSAENQASAFTHHFGGGAVVQQLFHKRSQDSIGIAATWVNFSSAPAAGFDLDGELALESYYKATITKHIALVQDFQFLHHPGGVLTNRDCPMITPRMVISF